MTEAAKVVRRQWKAALTRHRRSLNCAITEEDVESAKDSLKKLKSAYSEFETSHDLYNATLTNDEEIDASETWYDEVDKDYITALKDAKHFFCEVAKHAGQTSVVQPKVVSVSHNASVNKSTSSNDASGINDISVLSLLQMPKVELDHFDGDPIDYQRFMAIFDEIVDSKTNDANAKLSRLIQFTSGKAKQAIKNCALVGGVTGYDQARSILKKRFGDPNLISQKIIIDLKHGRPVYRPDELQQLADDLLMAQTALEQLGMSSELSNQSSMLDIVERCKPYVVNRWKRRALDHKRDHDSYPTFAKFVEFVTQLASETCDPVFGSERMNARNGVSSNGRKPKYDEVSVLAFNAEGASAGNPALGKITQFHPMTLECVVCRRNHSLFQCDQFKQLSPPARLDIAKTNRLCYNCLVKGHYSANCRKPSVCSVPECGRKHTKFVHIEPSVSDNGSSANVLNVSQASVSTNANNDFSSVCLPMVPVTVNGSKEVFYALLDSGSTNSFVSKHLATRLSLQGKVVNYRMNTLGYSNQVTSNVVSVNISPVCTEESFTVNKVVVVSNIPGRCPEQTVDMRRYPHLSDLPMQPVPPGSNADLLIGMDNAHLILPVEWRTDSGTANGLCAYRTKLGWALCGPLDVPGFSEISSCHVSIEQQVENLWQIENDDQELRGLSQEDKRVMSLWDREIQRDQGHYVLPIPWRDGQPNLPNNRHIALHRLKSLESRLERNGLMTKYEENLNKMLTDNYAESVPIDELTLADGSVWYLPHHAVINPAKPDKVRVVFDCAMKYNGKSLNNQCMQGPDLNNKLLDVLLRFRQFPFAVMADVEAMYHQIKIPVTDRNALRYLWSVNGKVREFRMTSHLFGGRWCASSSTFALRRTLDDFETTPLLHDVINRNFYVDDLLCSVRTRAEAQDVIIGSQSVLRNGGFNLTKFVSNDLQLLQSVDVNDRAKEVKEITTQMATKALGIKWDVIDDKFLYVSKHECDDRAVTRRVMLSNVSAMYDPLGLISPVVIRGKMLFQQATKSKLSWDSEVSPDLANRWRCWLSSLDALRHITFPRCVIPVNFDQGVTELHVFCDASESGYGACCYVRNVNQWGQISVTLMAGKGRLAPIKSITIPRLELLAAVEAVKLNCLVTQALDVQLLPTTFWSDSEITLAYIRNETARFKVFVSNRVSYIRQNSSPAQWVHVSGHINPADVLSRGCDVTCVPESWFVGPSYLMTHKSEWPSNKIVQMDISNDTEVKMEAEVCNVEIISEDMAHPIDTLTAYFSSLYRLCKAVCWLKRVLMPWRLRQADHVNGHMTASEIEMARVLIVRHVQNVIYSKEITSLQQSGRVAKSSSVCKLSPVLIDGLVCVGSRLQRASISDSSKFPIILPRDHKISGMVAMEMHDKGHLGVEWTLSNLRSKYWIVNARRILKRIGGNCVICKRLYGALMEQKMSDLPVERCISGGVPFTYVGLDFFGPIYVKRARSVIKRYGCIFTCFVTRAVHIEKVDSLEADGFINALIRFIARRGPSAKLWSDNGTNFVGANAEIRQCMRALDKQKVIAGARRRQVEWVFNPPYASHHGGVWERIIRTIRKILLALLHPNLTLTDEMLCTVFCEAECMINSRPITKSSDDPKDDVALTPNHLLLRDGNLPLPWGKFDVADCYRKQWRHVQHIASLFWARWVKEYLPQLHFRQKWFRDKPNVKVGDLVLIHGENSPRGLWPLGLVTAANVGRDGLVRSCRIRTKDTELVRPITKLVMLEGSDNCA